MTETQATYTVTTADPDRTGILAMIANNPELQPTTKAQYSKAITNALTAGVTLTDPMALADYAIGLNKSSRAFLKAVIRLWSNKIALDAKGHATPENVDTIQATVYRVEALQEAIKVESSKGEKAHTWLTQSEVKKLLATCNTNTTQGRRDRIVMGLLVGAGLRREELAKLTFDDIILQPVDGKIRTVLNIKGKGAKNRVVPLSDKLAATLDTWGAQAGPGNVARRVFKSERMGESISAIGIFQIVLSAGAAIGKLELAPHDLRRTYAQLGFEAGVPITQISKLLGHASVATTQRYLNLDLDLRTTVSDFIPFE